MAGRGWHATASWGLTSTTLLWALALPLAAAPGWLPASVVDAIYAIGHVICHQRPERSFHWAQHAWPVCARCTGIYLGAAVGVCLSVRLSLSHVVRAPVRVRRYLLVAVAPALVSLLFEWITGRVPSNGARAATGLVAGGLVALLLVAFLGEDAGRPAGSGPRA